MGGMPCLRCETGVERSEFDNTDDEDARENHRREKAQRDIAELPNDMRAAATLEEQTHINAYENLKKHVPFQSARPGLPSLLAGPYFSEGSFKCDFPGCTAVPFQTQYLLK